MSFDTLGLSDKVVQAVGTVGYTVPTPIQTQAIPHVLKRRDLLGIAQTGTGKTAGFVLPMLTLLEKGRARARMPRTLILEPTRELAAQVEENFDNYGVNHKLTVALLIGGVSFDEQDKKITRGADVLIATPGRLLDHFERGRLLLTGVEILVIDEADRMLDMGFIPDIERIVKLIPFTRQTLLFSATMPKEIRRLADQFLSNPVEVAVTRPASTGENISQSLARSGRKPHEKRAVLRALIDKAENLTNAIIFCNRKRDVATLQRSLERHGYSCGALHGDMDQHARLKMLDSFRDDRITLLVASDVAARGLDITAVSHIFNFDVPTHAEDYVHRIGRTGRAGRPGAAFTIATPDDRKYVNAIEELTGKPLAPVDVDVVFEPDGDDDDDARRDRRRSGSRGRSDARGRSRDRARARGTSGREAEAPGGVRNTATNEKRRKRAQSGKPERKQQQQPEHAGRDKSRSDGGKKQHREEPHRRDKGKRPVGFTDHVPAFLLKPTRIPKSADAEPEPVD